MSGNQQKKKINMKAIFKLAVMTVVLAMSCMAATSLLDKIKDDPDLSQVGLYAPGI